MPPAAGIVGPEDPRPQPSSRGGANVDLRALWALLGCRGFGCPRWFAGLSAPPIHPSPPGVASGGYGRPGIGEARRQPPAAIGSSSLGHWPATGSRILPGPWRILDEGQLLHHLRPSPPRPPGRRLTGNGDPLPETIKTPTYKQGRGRGRESGRGKGRGSVRGSGWGRRLKKTFIKPILSRPLSISNDG